MGIGTILTVQLPLSLHRAFPDIKEVTIQVQVPNDRRMKKQRDLLICKYILPLQFAEYWPRGGVQKEQTQHSPCLLGFGSHLGERQNVEITL